MCLDFNILLFVLFLVLLIGGVFFAVAFLAVMCLVRKTGARQKRFASSSSSAANAR
jgi:hypothetical protein